MSRLRIVLMVICAILLLSLLLAWYLSRESTEATANVKGLNLEEGMITLAGRTGCGSAQPAGVRFDSSTQFFNSDGEKSGPFDLKPGTTISFECAEQDKGAPAKKIVINPTVDIIQSVEKDTITLATGRGCGSSQQAPVVQYDSSTQFLDRNGKKTGASGLKPGTSISFECAEQDKAAPAKKIITNPSVDIIQSVIFKKGVITLATGKRCGSNLQPPAVKFGSRTEFVGPTGRKVEFSDLVRATTISFECVKDEPVKKITVKGISEHVKSVDFQAHTIELATGEGCGSTSPPTVKFDCKTLLFSSNGRKAEPSELVRATRISFECVENGPVKKIIINRRSDKDDPSFSLGHVVDSVVANTEQDRFSNVEGEMTFQDGALKWNLDPNKFKFDTESCRKPLGPVSCWVLAGDAGPNYFQCSYKDPPGCQVAELFKKVQQTMSTFHCFHLDEGRSSQSARTYTDRDNRVRVSVRACIPSKEPPNRVEVEGCTRSKQDREGVEVKECTLTVEVIPTPH